MDESCGSELQSLLKKAKEWENKYLAALPKPGGYTLMYDFKQLDLVTGYNIILKLRLFPHLKRKRASLL